MRKGCRYGFLFLVMVIALSFMNGCGKKQKEVQLKWVVYDVFFPEGWQEDFNELLKKKGIPCQVEFVSVSVKDEWYQGEEFDYRKYLKHYEDAVAVGKYDIIGLPGTQGYYDFYSIFAREGLLEPLEPYFTQGEAGETLRMVYPEKIWKTLEVDGTIYGLLNSWGNFKRYFVLNEKYLDKYGIIQNETVTVSAMEELLKTVAEGEQKEQNTLFVPVTGWNPFRQIGYEDTPCVMVSIDTRGEQLAAKSNLEIEQFKENSRRLHELEKDRIVQNSEGTLKQKQEGNFFAEMIYSYSTEAAVEQMRNGYGLKEEIRLKAVECPEGNNPFYPWGYRTALAKNSTNKKEAIELLAHIYADEELSNALAYGKEGNNYHIVDGKAVPDLRRGIGSAFQMYFGNNLITIPTGVDSSEKRTELQQVLEDIPPARQSGFYFDITNVEDEMGQVLRTYEKYRGVLLGEGESFEDDWRRMEEDFEQAGLSEIVDEMNRQLLQFQEEQKKTEM